MKKCSKCGVKKDESEFYKRKKSNDGLCSRCKECMKEYKHKHYKENKEKLSIKSKKYYKENKEKIGDMRKEYYKDNKCIIGAQKKEYYIENKEKINIKNKKYGKEYREENKEKIKIKQKEYHTENKEKIKEYRKNHPLQSVWHGIKQRCYNPKAINYKSYGGRGIKMSLEWFDSHKPFEEWALSNGWQQGYHTHRIDNDGDYEPGNVEFLNSEAHAEAHKK